MIVTEHLHCYNFVFRKDANGWMEYLGVIEFRSGTYYFRPYNRGRKVLSCTDDGHLRKMIGKAYDK